MPTRKARIRVQTWGPRVQGAGRPGNVLDNADDHKTATKFHGAIRLFGKGQVTYINWKTFTLEKS